MEKDRDIIERNIINSLAELDYKDIKDVSRLISERLKEKEGCGVCLQCKLTEKDYVNISGKEG